MPVDIQQFIETFIDESLETLQKTEQTLLHLETESIDLEKINTLFRYIHSIKSSSTVFGYDNISQLSHTLETFLDHARSGSYQFTQEDISLLLNAVDSLHEEVINIKNKKEQQETNTQQLNDMFKVKINAISEESKSERSKHRKLVKVKTAKEQEAEDKDQPLGWHIYFKPNRNILQHGNDPARLMSVLSELGKAEVKVNISQLPIFPSFDPSECFLTWDIKLFGHVIKKDIQEVFIWIVNEENVTIEPIYSTPFEEIEIEQKKSIKKIGAKESPSGQETIASVRVTVDKIDKLINIVGQLVITQSMLNQIVKDFDISRLSELHEGLANLEHNYRDLQASVMSIRTVPIEFIFNRIPRIIHDLAHKLKKKVELIITGEQTELDKNMMEKLNDPLLHLVRNALDHGIELPEVRMQNNKDPQGVVQLDAYQEAGNVVIAVSDDGIGLDKEKIRAKAIALGLINEQDILSDEEIYYLIFQPGFSTAKSVSDLSGRGVGLDVVYRSIQELGGEVEVESVPGSGSTFRLRSPLTLAIMDCQLVKLGDEVYIIPLISIIEIIKIEQDQLNLLDEKSKLYHYRSDYIPVIVLKEIFSMPVEQNEYLNKFLIIIELNGMLYGLVVDEPLSQQHVVIKNLEDSYGKVTGLLGVTILGDGRVALIIDIKAVVDVALNPNLVPVTQTGNLYENQAQSANESILEEKQKNKNTFQFLSFLMADQEYGIDILEVKEIRMWETTTALPNTPSYIKGIINVRGTIITIMDLRSRLGLGQSKYGPQTAVITLKTPSEVKSQQIGIVVDKVMDTHIVAYSDIRSFPENKNSMLEKHVLGLVNVKNKMITLLKTKNLLNVAREQEIAP